MYILDGVDKGAIKLDQKIPITNELRKNTRSPFAEKYPKGNVDLTVYELLEYMVSASDKEGLTAAVNDIGIITLPNGRHLAIAVFVSDFSDKPEVAEKTIADIAKAAYDEYNK